MQKLFISLFIKVIILFGIVFLLYSQYQNAVSNQKNSPLPVINSTTSIPNFDHIVILVMENKSEEDIIGNKDAPYLNSLASQNSQAGNFFAITHPSLPNYLALVGGDTFSIKSDCIDCFVNAKNLVDSLELRKKTWKGYMESMPNTCFVGNKVPYAQKHNPFIYFDNIRTNPDRCQKIVPYTHLKADLADAQTSPNFIWITPDLCHDMHDCTIKEGDTWLSQQIPAILDSQIFKTQNSLLVITWDEAESEGPNKIPTILIGPRVKENFVSEIKYDHYSLLHTIESAWNLPTLTENDKNSPVMSDFFN